MSNRNRGIHPQFKSQIISALNTRNITAQTTAMFDQKTL